MINVSSQQLGLVGDAHVIKFASGQVYVIDTGNEGDSGGKKLVSHLQKERTKKIDKLFISHAHRDHYGGVIDLLNSSIVVHEIYFNIPYKEVCDQERPWGCDYDHLMNLRQLIKNKGINLKSIHMGDTYNPNKYTKFQALFVQSGVQKDIGKTDINDTSAVMKLTYGKRSVLFTGDLNWKVGEFLTGNAFDLKADILKVPHHGTEGVVTNQFFDAVQPKIAMVPSLTSVWISDRSRRIREYFYNKNIPAYVSALHGDVSILIGKDSLKICISE